MTRSRIEILAAVVAAIVIAGLVFTVLLLSAGGQTEAQATFIVGQLSALGPPRQQPLLAQ